MSPPRKVVIKGTTQHKLAAVFCTTSHGKNDALQQAPSSGKRHNNVITKESCDQKVLHSINSLQSFAQPRMVKVTHCDKLQAAARGTTTLPTRKVVTKRHYTVKGIAYSRPEAK
ncbi:hypothetical protein ACFX14_002653 [Malus domestica]